MHVIHNKIPGKIICLGSYLRFSPDNPKKKGLTIEPNYSLDFGPGGFTVTGYVRMNGRFDRFKTERHEFYLNTDKYRELANEKDKESNKKTS